MKRILFALICLFIFTASIAQDPISVRTKSNGISDQSVQTLAFTHANIQVRPDLLLQDATLVVKGQRIVAVGVDIPIPKEALEIDVHGFYIFPSFVT